MALAFTEMSSALSSTSTRGCSFAQAVTPYATLASFYDALLGDRFFPEIRRAFEWLVRCYGIRFASAADVACGTGTFVHYLRELGVPVVYGVDRSPEMLRIATRKNEGNGARFLLQDFTTLALPQQVELITCNFDSLNYVLTSNDLLRTFRRFYSNLKPGGHLVFDMITDQLPRQDPEPHVEYLIGIGARVVRVGKWDSRRGIWTAVVSISRNGQSQREIHVQRGYPVAMVVRLLAQARLSVRGVHDFQTFGAATTRTSYPVYAARKPLREASYGHP